MIDLVLTIIGPDQPGIVDSLSEVVAAHDGNWLESRMAHFADPAVVREGLEQLAGDLMVEIRLAEALGAVP